MNTKDLIDKKIGNLQILEEFSAPYVGKDKNRKTILKLKCQCACGHIFTPYKTNVLTGKTTQCINCAGSNQYVNKKFDNLLCLSRDPNDSKKFICKCDCGKIVSVKKRYLNQGKSPRKCHFCRYTKKYCNRVKLNRKESVAITNYKKHMQKQEELIGHKFLNFKVLSFDKWQDQGKRRRAFYLCKCKCGKICSLRIDSIGKKLSCGCIGKMKLRGEKNYSAKFTNKQVKTMREMFKSGLYTQRKIAHMFNATDAHISQIIKEKTYRDI